MALFRAIVLFGILGLAYSQDANCDYYQQVQVGGTYYIYSPSYPSNYTPGVQCRWIAQCPTGYNCVLDCTEVNLPQTNGCSLDRLLISKSGDPQLSGAEYYCGRGSVSATSDDSTISVGLISAYTSPGGRFICTLTAKQDSGGGGGGGGGSCQCGYKRSNRIVGGVPTGVNEYPSMAGLVDTSIYQIKCGATIISDQYVLTAAHCLRYLSLSTTAVVVGEHDVTTGDSPATQVLRAASFIVHPYYNSNTFDYDIGLVRTATSITFSGLVGPACLPYKFVNTDFTGRYVTVLGWGTQFAGGPTSDVLREVDLQVISQQQCSQAVSFLSNRQMCTYTPGKDACQDDSGGPLLYTDPATGLLFHVGIVSSGSFCATQGKPGVNTRVAQMISWIEANTPQTTYCRK